jgi:hypothetical protein
MKCDRCGEEIPSEEEMEYHRQMLCEVCYMRALSPVKACNPWAVRSAQVLSKMSGGEVYLSETQENILSILAETGGLEAAELAERLKINITDLEVELATLRHMEKTRGEMRGSKKVVCLW